MTAAALFDVDKTLVNVNTARLYVKWRMSRREAGLAEYWMMSKVLLQYAVGTLDAEDAARAGFRTIAGTSESAMRADCLDWYRAVVRPRISEQGRRHLARHRAEGHTCAILSAATPYVTEPLAEDLGIDHVICTRLSVATDGTFTGAWEPPLCYGPGKVERARQWAATHGIRLSRSTFYTDSISDLPMLEAVGAPRVVNPDLRLRWIARQRRYPMEVWT